MFREVEVNTVEAGREVTEARLEELEESVDEAPGVPFTSASITRCDGPEGK